MLRRHDCSQNAELSAAFSDRHLKRVEDDERADEERHDLRNRFSLPKEDPQALDVLLSSEVGCEGFDYQFCDGLVTTSTSRFSKSRHG